MRHLFHKWSKWNTVLQTMCELLEIERKKGVEAERTRLVALIEEMRKVDLTRADDTHFLEDEYNEALSDVIAAIGEEKV